MWDLPRPGIKPGSPVLAHGYFTTEPSVAVVQSLTHFWFFVTPWTAAPQPSLPSPSPRACSNSCPLSWWCHPTISSSVIPFPSCLQSSPASLSFLMSHFASVGQRIGVSASTSVFLMNIQYWFPLGWTGLILQSKGLSKVFSKATRKV